MALRCCLLAAALLTASASVTQEPGDIVRWTAHAPASAVKPGKTALVTVSAAVQEGWMLYALTQAESGPNPLAVTVAKGQPFSIDAAKIEAPLPASKKTDAGDEYYYEGHVKLGVPVAAAGDVKAGTHAVPIEVTYQVCSGSICLRPHTETLRVKVNVQR